MPTMSTYFGASLNNSTYMGDTVSLVKTQEIHHHEYDLSSILYLSVDEVGYASDISFEAEQAY